MREIDRIIDELQRAYDGDPWHGPSVRDALEDIEAQQAAAKLSPDVHSIWELVHHMTSWTHEITRRLRLGIAQDPHDGDWPTVDPDRMDDASWEHAQEELRAAHEQLLSTLATLDDVVIDDVIGDVRDRTLGSGVSRYVTLHGLAQHHAYHAGQISILKKVLSSTRIRAHTRG